MFFRLCFSVILVTGKASSIAAMICSVNPHHRQYGQDFPDVRSRQSGETTLVQWPVPLLRGESGDAIATRDLFWHHPHDGNQGGDASSIIRRGPWKLIHYHEDGHDERYHLLDDPGEQHDRSAEQPERVARLRHIETVLMPKLEAQHAAYLDADWEPNPDWWGSQVTPD